MDGDKFSFLVATSFNLFANKKLKPGPWFSLFGSPVVGRWVISSNGQYSYVSQSNVFNGNVETPLATFYGLASDNRIIGESGAFITGTLKK